MFLRAMTPADHAAVARVWHEGWHDAHAGRVPDEMTAKMQPDAFLRRLHTLPPHLMVGGIGKIGGDIGGFIHWKDDLIQYLFLSRTARGTGLAARLMTAAEAAMAKAGVERAELDYVKGNERAARFYARQGYSVTREETDSVPEYQGSWVSVICHKQLGTGPAPKHTF
ncbi:GNAT family N-acetyltransferase [Psychromarinibacter sp. S121]|uniref:GNAT family N-acetyltransferase n=1 Tax=Psychromarinibacter sp. S121 TaxID=3415127 RepID=UPI003C7E3F88